jgi:hypothetical protein
VIAASVIPTECDQRAAGRAKFYGPFTQFFPFLISCSLFFIPYFTTLHPQNQES